MENIKDVKKFENEVSNFVDKNGSYTDYNTVIENFIIDNAIELKMILKKHIK
jgi:hypothetical protein